MRSATATSPRRLALLSLLATAGLAGCTRDLELPEPPTSPVIASFAPAQAFAGQLVRVTGVHFAAAATENTVNFAFASARVERSEGGALLVRVPPDAGTGPITVTNREGTSAASATPFGYLGRGEPARLQVASKTPILHRPRAVYAIGGDVLLDSALYDGLVWTGNTAFTSPTVERTAADPELGLVYVVHEDLMAGTQLIAIDATQGIVQATQFLPDVPHQILPLAGRNLVVTFHTNGLGEEVVAGWNATDLTELFPPTPYGVGTCDGAADVRDGRAVVAGYDPNFDRFNLFLLDLTGAPAPPLPVVEFVNAAGYAGPWPPPLHTAFTSRFPVAVAASGGGGPRAAAALEGGDVVLANLGTTPPEYFLDVETFSAMEVEAIVGGQHSGRAVALKPEAGYAFAFSVDDGSLRWIVDANLPAAVSTLPQVTAMESTDLAFVANAGDNDVLIVNVGTGLTVGSVNFDVGPRGADYGDAATFMPTGAGLDGDVIFPAFTFPGLLRIPIGTGAPSVISRTPEIDRLATSPADGALWQITSGLTPRLEGYLGYAGDTWATAVSVVLPAAPQRLAAWGTLAVVAHDDGLALVDGASPPAGAPPTAAIPNATTPAFGALGFTPAGDVWTLVETDAGPEAQLWTAASIAGSGTPTATRPLGGTPHSAAWLEDGLWVFSYDGAGVPVATLLDGSLSEVRTVATGERLTGIHGVSPNGRLLVLRESGGELGFLLRFFRADPDAGFPEVGSLVFDERVEALTFDAGGERLYLLTQLPDRLITID
jgi:hypothetical protein